MTDVARIIDDLPFRPYETTIRVPSTGEEVRVLHRQIVVWVSLTKPDQFNLPSDPLRFPAVLDPAFNESFLITLGQLRKWAHVGETDLPPADTPNVRVFGRLVSPRYANLWLHRNVSYQRDNLLGDPFPLEIDAGVIISPHEDRPRLPLLGLRVIESSRLRLIIDGGRQVVMIESPE